MDILATIHELRALAFRYRQESARLVALATDLETALEAFNGNRAGQPKPPTQIAVDGGPEALRAGETQLTGVVRLLRVHGRMKGAVIGHHLGVRSVSIHTTLHRGVRRRLLVRQMDGTYSLPDPEAEAENPPTALVQDDPTPRCEKYPCLVCGGDKVLYLGSHFPTSIEMVGQDAGPNPCTCSLGQPQSS